jgi:hypothetical protein
MHPPTNSHATTPRDQPAGRRTHPWVNAGGGCARRPEAVLIGASTLDSKHTPTRVGSPKPAIVAGWVEASART